MITADQPGLEPGSPGPKAATILLCFIDSSVIGFFNTQKLKTFKHNAKIGLPQKCITKKWITKKVDCQKMDQQKIYYTKKWITQKYTT